MPLDGLIAAIAEEDRHSLRIYSAEAGRIPVLSPSEERELFKEYGSTGSVSVRHKIAQANLKFVVTVAKSYRGRGLPFMDLVQQGNIGLMKAIDHFVYTKGFRFITYAVWWIRQTITEAIDEARFGMIHVPANVNEDAMKLDREKRQHFQTTGQMLTDRDISRTVKYESGVHRIPKGFVDLSDAADRDLEGRPYAEIIPGDDAYEGMERQDEIQAMRSLLKETMSALPQRERKVLQMRYDFKAGRTRTLMEVGKMMGLSRERVRQLEERAIQKLKPLMPLEVLAELNYTNGRNGNGNGYKI